MCAARSECSAAAAAAAAAADAAEQQDKPADRQSRGKRQSKPAAAQGDMPRFAAEYAKKSGQAAGSGWQVTQPCALCGSMARGGWSGLRSQSWMCGMIRVLLPVGFICLQMLMY